MIQRIVVGVDGSTNSKDALEWAVDLARSVSAEVIAVHAVGLLEVATTRDEAGRGPLREKFETAWCAPLSATGVARRRLLVDGDPVSVLLRVVGDVKADLLVVGRRGVGDHVELMLGSTSSQLTQRSVVPVVVVPQDSLVTRAGHSR